MTSIFQQIETIKSPPYHGWCSIAKGQTLAALVLALRPKVCVEIGVWGGMSLFPMALAIKELGTGIVWGIDPWAASASVVGQVHAADQDFWGKQAPHDLVYADFMKRLDEFGIQNCVRVIRSKSDDVEPPSEIGLLHIDGNHSDQAVKDVTRFAPNCPTGAICVMDDIGWSGGGVERAVAKLQSMGWRRLYSLEAGAVYQRT